MVEVRGGQLKAKSRGGAGESMEERGRIGSTRDGDHYARTAGQDRVTATLTKDGLNDVAPGHRPSIGGQAGPAA
jgi:hypothetical protein